MEYLICAAVGYLIGTVNPSYFLAKRKGFDIRKKGSGNAGASNALILFGKLRGVICAIFDILKATIAVCLACALFPTSPHAFAVTGVACILGHIFPFYLRFRGGKGLACLGGVILAFDWRVFLIMLSIETVIAVLTNYICFVPITASIAFPLVYGLMTHNRIGARIFFLVAFVVVFKHIENLKRIRNGTELRLSFLWKKDEELERLHLEEDKK